MHIRGARRVEIIGLHDPEQLMHVLKDALALRSSEVTERNPISSRSHAVCTIELLQVDCVAAMTRNGTDIDGSRSSSSSDSVSNGNDENHNSNNTCELVDDDNCSTGMDNSNKKEKKKAISLRNYLDQHNSSLINDRNGNVNGDRDDDVRTTGIESMKTTTVGKITLVDLAGSERNYETIQMTAAQHRESAEINFALMALKDCFRAYHMQQVTAKSKGSKPAIFDSNSRASGGHDSSKTSGLFTSTSLLSQCIKPSSTTMNIQNDDDLNITSNNHFKQYQQLNASTSDAKNYHTEATTGITSVSSSSLSSSSLSSSSSSLSSSSSTAAAIRIPFRSSLLTRVLKSCFTSSGTSHRTTIIATISPTPTDLQHTINTIAHTVLMCPELHRLTHRVTVEVPLFTHRSSYSSSCCGGGGEYHQYKPIQDWTSKDVLIWIGSVERGRFAHVVLPKDIDGKGMLQLSVSRLNDLFASSASNKARNQKEGKLMMMVMMIMMMIHDLSKS